MTITLNAYATGDTNYVAKFNQDKNTLETAINGILTALGTMGVSEGPFLNAIFGNSTAFIGSNSYTQSTASTTLTISSGYAWRPDLGTVLYKGSSTAINFAGQPAATYYIELGADGTPSSVSSSSFPMYSVVWTGSAFGTITTIASIVPNGDVTGNLQTLTLVAGAVTLSKMANLAANSIIGNNTGSPATPVALTASQVKTLLAIVVGDVSGAAPLASPTFTGTPSGPTASGGTNTTQFATTAFVQAALAALTGGLTFKGIWNANTNSPTVTSSTGTLGWFYKVGTAGTTTIDGISSWNVGDLLLFDGSTWDKIDGISTEVVSVAGRTGAVTLTASDIVSGLAAIATSGSASDLASGTVPVARLPVMVASGTGHAAGAVPDPGASAGTTRFLCEDATFKTVAGASGGTVTSVALTMPSDFSVGGSPITGSGTLAVTAANQSANTVKAGPTSGAAAAPTYRALVAADIPALRFHIKTFFPGTQTTASQLMLRDHAAIAATIPTSGNKASAKTASTGTAVLTIKQNGSSVGTVTFTASATGVFSVSSPVTVAIDDIITIEGPSTPDTTLADISITLAATA